MNRLGLSKGEFASLYHEVRDYKKPINALEHLAKSESCNKFFTSRQLKRFQAFIKNKSFVHISAFN